nr:zinc finger E-box-binding homeobox 1b isoform X1 [Nothobranchius furzeri]
MADGPRCKRRKQANPRRTSVANYSSVVEPGSDSDDEDKLHIVEEDGSLADAAECDSTLPDDELPSGHSWDLVKADCASEGEDDLSTDALVEEMLQQGDTAIIYPEAPDDDPNRQGTPDASIHDENGTPDSFSQLLTCPYCSRGYKRYSSLKEHIKYHHEKTGESFSCTECSYSFAHCAQLERHMNIHKFGRDQKHTTQSTGNRKFKCSECGKAFKYKHHLKEHLRIHSGEKPYECSNCKKRFSHSGSYSSHISSKKCISVISPNSGQRLSARSQSQAPSPVLPPSPSVHCSQIREKLEHSKTLQEQLPLHQVKVEPADYEYKPAALTPPPLTGGVFSGGAAASLQGTVQAVVLPTVGLVSPISINLVDLQKALKVAVDKNVIRQVLESNSKGQMNSGLTTGAVQQQLISAINLPIVGQDGNAKIIINYSLDPSQGQLTSHNLKKEQKPVSPTQTAPDMFKFQKLPEDPIVRGCRAHGEKTTRTCLLCDNCPGGLEDLHALKHHKKGGVLLNGAGLNKSESAVSALLSGEGLCNQPKNVLSLLKAYFALNAEPSKDELAKISDSMSLPILMVKKWFDKMQEGQISFGAPTPPSEEEDSCDAHTVVSLVQKENTATMMPTVSQGSPTEATPAEVNGAHSSPASPTPLNLMAGSPILADNPQSTEGPLDLSLPKQAREEADTAIPAACVYTSASSGADREEEPLNLTCTRKDTLPLSAIGGSPVELYASQPSAKPLDIVTTMQCLKALSTTNKQTILIPQLAYTYTTTANSPAGTQMDETIHLNGITEESSIDEQNDSDSGPARKKMKKTDGSMYACDLCDKIFQKSSSLLRHKYEHTEMETQQTRQHFSSLQLSKFGKRPHECSICNKAFKHKHHLIEHMRLHSGEKPYQCDKCGKRFSHSGSYSQHMNHRYSYCKKDTQSQAGDQDSPEEDGETRPDMQNQHMVPLLLDSDERGGSTREDEESEEEEEGMVDMDDIQVVQIGEKGGDNETEEQEGRCNKGIVVVSREKEEEKAEMEEDEEASTKQEVLESLDGEEDIHMKEEEEEAEAMGTEGGVTEETYGEVPDKIEDETSRSKNPEDEKGPQKDEEQ